MQDVSQGPFISLVVVVELTVAGTLFVVVLETLACLLHIVA
jgi:hypothetical protein